MPPESTGQRKLVASHRRINVQVSQEHINLATRADSSHCMIADALRAALPDAKKVSVDLQTIRFTDPKKGQRFTYLTPTIAQDYLVAFDQGLPLTPFNFSLHAPVQVGHAGSRQPGESRGFEGMKATKGTSIPVKVGGEPMPMAALYHGPGRLPSAVEEHLTAQAAETEPIISNDKPTSQPEPDFNDKPTHESEPITTTETQHERVQEMVGNVTLTTTGGRVRRYGMHQLRPRNLPRGPIA